jgi:alkaline phosphatase D
MKYLALLLLLLPTFAFSQSNALNLYPDSIHHPFIYGVASGDPTTTTVQLWTYAGPSTLGQEVTWLVATDSLFTNVVASGTVEVIANNGYTVKPIATGLQPNTNYYYRFYAPGNSLSVTGHTQTAPSSPNQAVNFGIASCSSVFSGYFNAYRQMAKDTSISVIIHLGDYIYDFVDEDEQIRITTPFPTSPSNLNEWRDRHMYYLLDPDLRLARQMHPWVQTWDNHDFEQNGPVGTRAFFEFTPTTPPLINDSNRIYRKISYGLTDIFLIDLMSYRNDDEISPGNNSSLGLEQFAWLTQGLAASTAKWKIVGSPKMMTQWSIAGLEQVIGSNSPVLFTSSWDGYPAEREAFLTYVDSAQINNVVVLSGDSHFSQSADLPLNPNSPAYNPATGSGSIAVEYLPTSISRGNFDEMGYSASLADFIIGLINNNNPNHIYTELIQHGYGLLNIKPDSATADYVYCPILEMSDDTVMAGKLVVMDGDNHWKRPSTVTPNSVDDVAAEKIIIYPNPANDALWVQLPKNTAYTTLEVYDNVGRKIASQSVVDTIERVDLSNLSAGMYSIVLYGNVAAPVSKRFLKE